MMTAAEARTRLESRNFTSTIKQLVEIEAAMNKAIDGGDSFICYPHIVSVAVEEKLREIGYRVSVMNKTTHISFL